jgi:hypothetical protein
MLATPPTSSNPSEKELFSNYATEQQLSTITNKDESFGAALYINTKERIASGDLEGIKYLATPVSATASEPSKDQPSPQYVHKMHGHQHGANMSYHTAQSNNQNIGRVQLTPQNSDSHLNRSHSNDSARWAPYRHDSHAMRPVTAQYDPRNQTANRPQIFATGAQYPNAGFSYQGMPQQPQYQQNRQSRDFAPKPAGFTSNQVNASRSFAPRPVGYASNLNQQYPNPPMFAATGPKDQEERSRQVYSQAGSSSSSSAAIAVEDPMHRDAEGVMRGHKARKPNKSLKSNDEVYSSRKRRLVNYCMKLNSFLNRRCFITEPKCMNHVSNAYSGQNQQDQAGNSD